MYFFPNFPQWQHLVQITVQYHNQDININAVCQSYPVFLVLVCVCIYMLSFIISVGLYIHHHRPTVGPFLHSCPLLPHFTDNSFPLSIFLTPATANLFSISTVLSFHKCYINAICNFWGLAPPPHPPIQHKLLSLHLSCCMQYWFEHSCPDFSVNVNEKVAIWPYKMSWEMFLPLLSSRRDG